MTNEQRKKRILKKADQAFIECGFNIKAKDVVGKKFVMSRGHLLYFGAISSFRIKATGIHLYPKFERCEGHDNVDAIILKMGESYSNPLNTFYVFRNDPNFDLEIFFDFI